MPIDFPNSPIAGQKFTADNRSWEYNGSVWEFLGAPGPANELIVGTVTTGDAGTNVSVNISGTPPQQEIDFTIPRGAAATIAVGTVTTGDPGTNASVTNSGTTEEAIFDFSIPRGADGTNGQGVPVGGSTGQVLAKASSADYNTQWISPVTTGKAIAMAIVFG